LKNYRPIFLICVDRSKIAAATLARQLQEVIKRIVNTDQRAYINGRGVFQNIKLIDSLLWFTDVENLPGAKLALYNTKAFDSISNHFILKLLAQFNFIHDFRRWVEVYTQVLLSIMGV
jgi:hypothetical protein